MMTETMDKPADLLEAAGKQVAPVERRKGPQRRVRRDRRKGVKRSVGLEVSPEGVSLSIVERSEGDAQPKLIIRHEPFPADSAPVHGDWSDSTLRDLLSDLAAEYHLSGQAVVVGLGGDPCVTRVVMGENDDVEKDTQELTDRARRYIGMGRGEKVCCKTHVQLDARRKRTWVTVAIRSVVDAVAEAVEASGMRLARIEHTMMVLCRILQATDQDFEKPVMMIVDENGRMDLGISFRGQLLLDYRPAMSDNSESDGDIVARHIKCIRRYLFAKLKDAPSDLCDVYITGDNAKRECLYASLEEHPELQAHHFSVAKIADGFELHGEVSEDPGVLASVWLATCEDRSSDLGIHNDLMSTVRTNGKFPWLRLFTSAWPITAAAVLALAILGASKHEFDKADSLQAQVDLLNVDNLESKRLHFIFEQELGLRTQVEHVAEGIDNPDWATILWKAGSLMPEGVWLESVRIDNRPRLSVVGSSFTDDAIYDYIGRLEEESLFTHVALVSTNATRAANGPAFRFEISAVVVDKEDSVEPAAMASLVVGGKNNGY